jgi:hypothetical protein
LLEEEEEEEKEIFVTSRCKAANNARLGRAGAGLLSKKLLMHVHGPM